MVTKSEELDAIVSEIVSRSQCDPAKSRQKLREIASGILLQERKTCAKHFLEGVRGACNHIARRVIDERHFERSLTNAHEDDNISYFGKSVPCPKADGSRFYTCGDLHFFRKIGEREYLLGRMDGMHHGFEAAVIVLAAEKYIDDSISAHILHPKGIAERLNQRCASLFGYNGFTTLFISLLKDKKVLLTNVGDGATLFYDPLREDIEVMTPHGFPVGSMSRKEAKKFGEDYKEEEKHAYSRVTIISYTDGIESLGFDIGESFRIIKSELGDVKRTVEHIFEHSMQFKQKTPDDATVIGLYIK